MPKKTISVRLTCPLCGTTERMPVTPLRYFREHLTNKDVTPNIDQARRFAGAAMCPHCQQPYGVSIGQGDTATITGIFLAGSNDGYDAALKGAFINTVPTSKYVLHADPNLPPMIREPFVCIQEDVLRRRNPTGIMSGARSCLDVALKDKGEATGGRRDRIQRLAEKKVITQSIADWAQTLWEEGNDATHDLTANLDRAIEHVEFLKLFFEVAYGLPARIEAAMTMESEQPMSNLAEESGNPTIESAA